MTEQPGPDERAAKVTAREWLVIGLALAAFIGILLWAASLGHAG